MATPAHSRSPPPATDTSLASLITVLEPPSPAVVDAAITLLLVGIGQRNSVTIPVDVEETMTSQHSVQNARLHMDALTIIANNCLRGETLNRIGKLGKHINRLAPIAKLPPELVASIISREIVHYEEPYFVRKVRRERLRELSAVCLSWYILIRDHAPFWTSVTNVEGPPQVTLQRSRDAPLNIEYAGSTVRDTLAFFHQIDFARSRWRSVWIDLTTVSISGYDSDSESSIISGSDDDSHLRSSNVSKSTARVKPTEVDLFHNLSGPALQVIDIASTPGHIGFRGAPLPLGECPSLEILAARNISVQLSPGSGQHLPSLSHLFMHGFLARESHWRAGLLLTAASENLVKLHLAPHEGPGHLELGLVEVNEAEIPLIRLLNLRELTISKMPPRTFHHFVHRTTLNPKLLIKLDLTICNPMEETLGDLFEPAATSISRAIHLLSISHLGATLSATFGFVDSLVYHAGKSSTTGLNIDIEGVKAITTMLLHPSNFTHPQAPQLHISLSCFDTGWFDTETLRTLMSATPLVTACEVRDEVLSTEIVAILRGQPEISVGGWPELARLTIRSCVDEVLREELENLALARSEWFQAGQCRAKLVINW